MKVIPKTTFTRWWFETMFDLLSLMTIFLSLI